MGGGIERGVAMKRGVGGGIERGVAMKRTEWGQPPNSFTFENGNSAQPFS